MIAAFRSELRKLLTVRSTYVTTILSLGLIAFINFWVLGYKALGTLSGDYLQNVMVDSFSAVGILIGVVPVLLITHEYRYNTIFYSLTQARSRTRVFVAKFLVGVLYALLFAVGIIVVSLLAAKLGLALNNNAQMSTQHIAWASVTGRCLFYAGGIAIFGMLIASIVRNQIGTFVTFLIAPGTIESLAGLVLKGNTGYLPFTALGNVIMAQPMKGFSHAESAIIAASWLVGVGIITWQLFLRRDAN